MKKLLIATTLISSTMGSLHAAPIELWKGKGEMRSLDNKVLETYTLTVARQVKSPTSRKVTVDVIASDGRLLYNDQCDLTLRADHSWKKTCSKSTGGGYMMNYNLGSEYVTDASGKAWSTNIILDDANRMRLQRVELLNGKAQKLFVESLTKVE